MLLVCHTGNRSSLAAQLLHEGYEGNMAKLVGNASAWRTQGRPVHP